MGHHLLHLDISLTEKIVRTIAVYLALAVLIRLAGKRDLAQLNSFDLVVMLLLSNVVQNAVIGPDNSLLGGLAGAAVLVAINALVVRASAASPPLARIFEGSETVLVDDGHYDDRALRREGVRRADLEAGLRRQGAGDVSEVQRATLGTGGAVVVTLKPEAAAATKADVAAIAAALNRLEQKLK
ncbi:MAG: hypothetical protein QOJ03_2533 [Frankiaceae bacterium]|nr:hypothetical protein [Frankiaceae bacterium]